MIRLFASDLDGTLLNEEHETDDVIRNALRQIKADGKVFTAATGRQLRSGQAADLGFEQETLYIIGMNGALIMDGSGQILRKESLSRDFLQAFLRTFPDMNLEFHGPVYSYVRVSRETFIREFYNRMALPSMPPMTKEKKDVILKRFLKELRFEQSDEQIAGQEILKINYRTSDPQQRARLDAFLKERVEDAANAPFDADGYEITCRHANKGEAVAWLGAYLGISEDETAVYGDGYNDLEMLRRFAHSYATMNAAPEAKAAASQTIGYCADHAVPEHILMTLAAERDSAAATVTDDKPTI